MTGPVRNSGRISRGRLFAAVNASPATPPSDDDPVSTGRRPVYVETNM